MNIGGINFKNTYVFECFDKDGNLKWREVVQNTVVNAGLNDVLDKYLKGSSYTAAFYVGLKGAGTIAAADTMSSHAGWSEVTDYDEATRPALTLGSVSSQSVDNSASAAAFTISDTVTVAGGFITTDNVIGATDGTLFGAVDFSASRSCVDDDVINVTATFTAANA